MDLKEEYIKYLTTTTFMATYAMITTLIQIDM